MEVGLVINLFLLHYSASNMCPQAVAQPLTTGVGLPPLRPLPCLLKILRRDRRDIQFNNGRLDYCTGPSVGLYSKTFAQLIDALNDLSGVVPTPREITSTGKFMQEMSVIYPMDILRRDVVFERLNTLLGVPIHLRVEVGDKGVVGDGDGMSLAPLGIGERAILAYYQVTSELGSTGDAILQAALSYRKHIAHCSVRH
jgi:hypothetical protein